MIDEHMFLEIWLQHLLTQPWRLRWSNIEWFVWISSQSRIHNCTEWNTTAKFERKHRFYRRCENLEREIEMTWVLSFNVYSFWIGYIKMSKYVQNSLLRIKSLFSYLRKNPSESIWCFGVICTRQFFAICVIRHHSIYF